MEMTMVVVGSGVKIHYATRHPKTNNIDGTLCGAGNIGYSMRGRPKLYIMSSKGFKVDCKHCKKLIKIKER